MPQAARITIPDGVSFSDLALSRDTVTGDVSFNWEPIEAICASSGLDVSVFKDQHEDNVSGLIVAWYAAHLASGGAIDKVAEQIRAEVEAEDRFGEAAVMRGSGTH